VGKRYRLSGGGELVLNNAEFNALRRGPEIRKDIEARVNRVAAVAGDGFEASMWDGKQTARGSVVTGTFEARRKQAKEGNTLQRSLDAGR
jgi:hypothetical protein